MNPSSLEKGQPYIFRVGSGQVNYELTRTWFMKGPVITKFNWFTKVDGMKNWHNLGSSKNGEDS